MAAPTVDTSGQYADYRGTRFRELFYGDDWSALLVDADADRSAFPDALGFGDNRQGSWVKVPKASLDRRAKVTVEGEWHGEPVTVARAGAEGMVVLHYDRDPDRARELGMDGDERNGWSLMVPADQVSVTEVSEKEIGR